jgi:hypothetical protein
MKRGDERDMIGSKETSTRGLKSTAVDSAIGLAFNVSVFAAPLAAASLAALVLTTQLVDYSPTEANKRATEKAVAAETKRFLEGAGERREAWSRLVLRELDEGDAAAARGFVLSAPVLLSGGDLSKINRTLRPGADDNDLMYAAAGLLDQTTADRFRFAGRTGIDGVFDVLGDSREVANQARRWLAREPMDAFLFALSGATLALGAPDPATDDARLGGSIIKIARTSARLPQPFAESLEIKLEAAAPPERLRAELAGVFQSGVTLVDEGAAATLAFSRAIDREAYRVLATDLANVGAIARATSPAGAVQLLRDVDTSEDLVKLRLIAEASRERAVAVSKRSPERLLLKAARGSIAWTPPLVLTLAALALSVAVMCVMLALAFQRTLLRAWTGAGSNKPARSKAEAVMRAREPNVPKTSSAAADV